MSSKEIIHENVNGVMLTLDINCRNTSPNSKQFTISFRCGGTGRGTSYWSKTSLLFAIVFNIIAISYVHISLNIIVLIASILGFLLFLWITHSVQSETLLVIPTVGIQTCIKYIRGKENFFIPWSGIDDVIINEVIQLNRVLYYLTVLVKEADKVKLIPLFKCTKPRLLMLEAIYSEMQSLLRSSQLASDDSLASGDKC